MQPYEVLITKSVYGEDGDEQTPEIIFGPGMVFAYSESDAVKKAVIEKNITSTDVDDVDFFVRAFVNEGSE